MDTILKVAQQRAAVLREKLRQVPEYRELGEVLKIIKLCSQDEVSHPASIATIATQTAEKVRVQSRTRTPQGFSNKKFPKKKYRNENSKRFLVNQAAIALLKRVGIPLTSRQVMDQSDAVRITMGNAHNRLNSVSATLSQSPDFYYVPGEGYALKEWKRTGNRAMVLEGTTPSYLKDSVTGEILAISSDPLGETPSDSAPH